MERVFDLINALEGYSKCKVNFKINNEYYNCDLGVIEEVNNELVFIPKYTSAVVERSNINATDEELLMDK
mgnify:CR=1 FL=1